MEHIGSNIFLFFSPLLPFLPSLFIIFLTSLSIHSFYIYKLNRIKGCHVQENDLNMEIHRILAVVDAEGKKYCLLKNGKGKVLLFLVGSEEGHSRFTIEEKNGTGHLYPKPL